MSTPEFIEPHHLTEVQDELTTTAQTLGILAARSGLTPEALAAIIADGIDQGYAPLDAGDPLHTTAMHLRSTEFMRRLAEHCTNQMEQDAVVARDKGAKWWQVGAAAGLSPQRAQQKFGRFTK